MASASPPGSPTLPQTLEPVSGPIAPAKLEGAAAGMGDHGPATRRLIEAGLVPPDLICGMTLFLLARQPRQPRATGEKPASGIAGGVWVRERFTIHRPLPQGEVFVVTGRSTGREVRKGRRYGTTSSETVDGQGRPVATNLTTGLLSYRPDPDLADAVEGVPADETPTPGPDRAAAAANPHLDRLRRAAVGDRLGGHPVTVSLAMMAARDTDRPDNPIHSDPEEARKAGLARPIAGGSHVASFAIEALLAEWGPESLSHGANFDLRWKAPTEADAVIIPTATVTSVADGLVIVDLEVTLADGPTAMTGTVVVPVASA